MRPFEHIVGAIGIFVGDESWMRMNNHTENHSNWPIAFLSATLVSFPHSVHTKKLREKNPNAYRMASISSSFSAKRRSASWRNWLYSEAKRWARCSSALRPCNYKHTKKKFICCWSSTNHNQCISANLQPQLLCKLPWVHRVHFQDGGARFRVHGNVWSIQK